MTDIVEETPAKSDIVEEPIGLVESKLPTGVGSETLTPNADFQDVTINIAVLGYRSSGKTTLTNAFTSTRWLKTYRTGGSEREIENVKDMLRSFITKKDLKKRLLFVDSKQNKNIYLRLIDFGMAPRLPSRLFEWISTLNFQFIHGVIYMLDDYEPNEVIKTVKIHEIVVKKIGAASKDWISFFIYNLKGTSIDNGVTVLMALFSAIKEYSNVYPLIFDIGKLPDKYNQPNRFWLWVLSAFGVSGEHTPWAKYVEANQGEDFNIPMIRQGSEDMPLTKIKILNTSQLIDIKKDRSYARPLTIYEGCICNAYLDGLINDPIILTLIYIFSNMRDDDLKKDKTFDIGSYIFDLRVNFINTKTVPRAEVIYGTNNNQHSITFRDFKQKYIDLKQNENEEDKIKLLWRNDKVLLGKEISGMVDLDRWIMNKLINPENKNIAVILPYDLNEWFNSMPLVLDHIMIIKINSFDTDFIKFQILFPKGESLRFSHLKYIPEDKDKGEEGGFILDVPFFRQLNFYLAEGYKKGDITVGGVKQEAIYYRFSPDDTKEIRNAFNKFYNYTYAEHQTDIFFDDENKDEANQFYAEMEKQTIKKTFIDEGLSDKKDFILRSYVEKTDFGSEQRIELFDISSTTSNQTEVITLDLNSLASFLQTIAFYYGFNRLLFTLNYNVPITLAKNLINFKNAWDRVVGVYDELEEIYRSLKQYGDLPERRSLKNRLDDRNIVVRGRIGGFLLRQYRLAVAYIENIIFTSFSSQEDLNLPMSIYNEFGYLYDIYLAEKKFTKGVVTCSTYDSITDELPEVEALAREGYEIELKDPKYKDLPQYAIKDITKYNCQPDDYLVRNKFEKILSGRFLRLNTLDILGFFIDDFVTPDQTISYGIRVVGKNAETKKIEQLELGHPLLANGVEIETKPDPITLNHTFNLVFLNLFSPDDMGTANNSYPILPDENVGNISLRILFFLKLPGLYEGYNYYWTELFSEEMGEDFVLGALGKREELKNSLMNIDKEMLSHFSPYLINPDHIIGADLHDADEDVIYFPTNQALSRSLDLLTDQSELLEKQGVCNKILPGNIKKYMVLGAKNLQYCRSGASYGFNPKIKQNNYRVALLKTPGDATIANRISELEFFDKNFGNPTNGDGTSNRFYHRETANQVKFLLSFIRSHCIQSEYSGLNALTPDDLVWTETMKQNNVPINNLIATKHAAEKSLQQQECIPSASLKPLVDLILKGNKVYRTRDGYITHGIIFDDKSEQMKILEYNEIDKRLLKTNLISGDDWVNDMDLIPLQEIKSTGKTIFHRKGNLCFLNFFKFGDGYPLSRIKNISLSIIYIWKPKTTNQWMYKKFFDDGLPQENWLSGKEKMGQPITEEELWMFENQLISPEHRIELKPGNTINVSQAIEDIMEEMKRQGYLISSGEDKSIGGGRRFTIDTDLRLRYIDSSIRRIFEFDTNKKVVPYHIKKMLFLKNCKNISQLIGNIKGFINDYPGFSQLLGNFYRILSASCISSSTGEPFMGTSHEFEVPSFTPHIPEQNPVVIFNPQALVTAPTLGACQPDALLKSYEVLLLSGNPRTVFMEATNVVLGYGLNGDTAMVYTVDLISADVIKKSVLWSPTTSWNSKFKNLKIADADNEGIFPIKTPSKEGELRGLYFVNFFKDDESKNYLGLKTSSPQSFIPTIMEIWPKVDLPVQEEDEKRYFFRIVYYGGIDLDSYPPLRHLKLVGSTTGKAVKSIWNAVLVSHKILPLAEIDNNGNLIYDSNAITDDILVSIIKEKENPNINNAKFKIIVAPNGTIGIITGSDQFTLETIPTEQVPNLAFLTESISIPGLISKIKTHYGLQAARFVSELEAHCPSASSVGGQMDLPQLSKYITEYYTMLTGICDNDVRNFMAAIGMENLNRSIREMGTQSNQQQYLYYKENLLNAFRNLEVIAEYIAFVICMHTNYPEIEKLFDAIIPQLQQGTPIYSTITRAKDKFKNEVETNFQCLRHALPIFYSLYYYISFIVRHDIIKAVVSPRQPSPGEGVNLQSRLQLNNEEAFNLNVLLELRSLETPREYNTFKPNVSLLIKNIGQFLGDQTNLLNALNYYLGTINTKYCDNLGVIDSKLNQGYPAFKEQLKKVWRTTIDQVKSINVPNFDFVVNDLKTDMRRLITDFNRDIIMRANSSTKDHRQKLHGNVFVPDITMINPDEIFGAESGKKDLPSSAKKLLDDIAQFAKQYTGGAPQEPFTPFGGGRGGPEPFSPFGRGRGGPEPFSPFGRGRGGPEPFSSFGRGRGGPDPFSSFGRGRGGGGGSSPIHTGTSVGGPSIPTIDNLIDFFRALLLTKGDPAALFGVFTNFKPELFPYFKQLKAKIIYPDDDSQRRTQNINLNLDFRIINIIALLQELANTPATSHNFELIDSSRSFGLFITEFFERNPQTGLEDSTYGQDKENKTFVDVLNILRLYCETGRKELFDSLFYTLVSLKSVYSYEDVFDIAFSCIARLFVMRIWFEKLPPAEKANFPNFEKHGKPLGEMIIAIIFSTASLLIFARVPELERFFAINTDLTKIISNVRSNPAVRPNLFFDPFLIMNPGLFKHDLNTLVSVNKGTDYYPFDYMESYFKRKNDDFDISFQLQLFKRNPTGRYVHQTLIANSDSISRLDLFAMGHIRSYQITPDLSQFRDIFSGSQPIRLILDSTIRTGGNNFLVKHDFTLSVDQIIEFQGGYFYYFQSVETNTINPIIIRLVWQFEQSPTNVDLYGNVRPNYNFRSLSFYSMRKNDRGPSEFGADELDPTTLAPLFQLMESIRIEESSETPYTEGSGGPEQGSSEKSGGSEQGPPSPTNNNNPPPIFERPKFSFM